MNPKDGPGSQKAALHLLPPAALEQMAAALKCGADKYGAYNYRQHEVKATVYQAAAMRHLLAWFSGENNDPESGASHLGHVMACAALLLDAAAVGAFLDDRP